MLATELIEQLALPLQRNGICVVAGEASGDVHGAFLIESLRQVWAERGIPDVRFWGIGGPRMAAVGCEILIPITDLAVMGVGEALAKYPKISAAHKHILHALRQNNPVALICCDYPGFNLRLTAEAYGLGIVTLYHIPPKAWSHGAQRAQKLKEYTYLVTSILPFEETFFRSFGVNCCFVGNPLRDAVQTYSVPPPPAPPPTRDPWRIGLLPGSRAQELRRLLPLLLSAFVELSKDDPRFHAQIPVAHTLQPQDVATQVQSILTALGKDELWQKQRVQLVVNDTYHVMATSRYAWVCSGTATLETAFFGTPFALVYKTSWLTFQLAKWVLKIPYVGLANLCAKREVVPEFLQKNATVQNLVAHARKILGDPVAEAHLVAELGQVRDMFPLGGSRRAAQAMVDVCVAYGTLSPALRWKKQRGSRR